MDNFFKIANRIEAGIWFSVALLLLVKALKAMGRVRRILLILSATFVVFGISDLIEAETGAWWQPLWLLLMKGACLIVFVFGFRAYFKAIKEPDKSA
jgi:phosphoglycerol transferase MdoB-like AlkP superfamily enzyme